MHAVHVGLSQDTHTLVKHADFTDYPYLTVTNNARNGSWEKKPWKAKTRMGERHHIYVWYDGSSKQSGGGQASISQRHMGSDVLTRICSEKRTLTHFSIMYPATGALNAEKCIAGCTAQTSEHRCHSNCLSGLM